MSDTAGQSTGGTSGGDDGGRGAIPESRSPGSGAAPGGGDHRPSYRKAPWDKRHLTLVWAQLGMNERRCLRTMGELGGQQALDSLVDMKLLTKDGARTPKGQAVLKVGGR